VTALDWEAVARSRLHPLAASILDLLTRQDGPARTWSPTALSQALDKPLGNVSYHVRRLHDDGLIELVQTKPVRGALEHFYRVADKAVAR
jgi:hypothetical protein